MPFITDEMAAGMSRLLEQMCAEDPLLAEDVESILESKDFIVRPGSETARITCECCGIPVADFPERETGQERWKRAIWEPDTGRKHTLRRCNWLRSQADVR